MMTIDDIEIKIKKWDKAKNNQVIVNITVLNTIEVRGYMVRYTTTKYSPSPVWIVTPPSKQGRNKIMWFHIVRITDSRLWEQLQKKIIELVKSEYSS